MRWLFKTRTVREREAAVVWQIAIAAMGICVLAAIWFPLISLNSLASKNYNEGWNAYRQWMAASGQKLYGAPASLWTTNYPPLSFHLVAWLGRAKADMVFAGRALALFSLAAVSLIAGLMVRELNRSRAAAIYSGLFLFAAIMCFERQRSIIDDPEMLAAAFAVFGLFAYIKSANSLAWAAVAGISFCLSLFTKQDYIAFPLCAGLYLLATRRWLTLALFVASGVAAGLVLLALTLHLDGPHFFGQFLQKRAYSPAQLLQNTFKYLEHFLPLPIVGVITLWRPGNMENRGFLLLLLAVANLVAACFSGGDGVAFNVFIPAIIADLVACVTGICRLQAQGGHWFRLALAAASLPVLAMAPGHLRDDIAVRAALPASDAAAAQAIALLEAVKGPVICEDILLCYDAGKPIDYDPFYVNDLILTGQLREADIIALLAARHYAAIQLSSDATGAWQRLMAQRFTPAIQRAMLNAYRPVWINRNVVVLLPGG